MATKLEFANKDGIVKNGIIHSSTGKSVFADEIYWGSNSFFKDTQITSTQQLLETIAANAGGGDAAEITTSTSDYISIDETDKHKIGANVVNIANYANLTLNEETGKWESPDDTTEVTIGLADASDIAATIVSDEKVIAEALNKHNASIVSLSQTIGSPATITKPIYDKDGNSVTVNEITENGVYYTEAAHAGETAYVAGSSYYTAPSGIYSTIASNGGSGSSSSDNLTIWAAFSE